MLQEMYFVIVIGSVALKQKPRGITQERVISEIFLIPPWKLSALTTPSDYWQKSTVSIPLVPFGIIT